MQKQFVIFFTAVSLLQFTTGVCQTANSSDNKVYQPEPPKENYFNTVTGRRGSSQYKFVLIGDKEPVLAINQKEVSRKELFLYEELIDSLSHVVWERQRKETEKFEQHLKKKKLDILADLVQQKLAVNKEAVRSFYLTWNRLMVNDIMVSPKAFEFFKKKYILSEDKAIYYEQ